MNEIINSRGAQSSIDKYLLFAFGVIFISVLLWLVFRTSEPLTVGQADLVHLVSALAAAGFGATLPGFIEVKYRKLFRAGGAAAFFVLVFVYQPERAVAPAGTWPTIDASKVVERHLELVDAGRYVDAYAELAPEGKMRISQPEFLEAFQAGREPYGEVMKRVKIGVTGISTLQDGTKGPFKVYTFVTTFKTGVNAQEPVWAMAVGKNDWGVLFHNVLPCADNRCGTPPEPIKPL